MSPWAFALAWQRANQLHEHGWQCHCGECGYARERLIVSGVGIPARELWDRWPNVVWPART